MREFIYYSSKARTSGNFDIKNLMKAGRMDIVCNVIISVFFLSNKMRDDVHLHLIFTGPPNPPMHLEFISHKDMPISKKDIAGLIRVMLYKCKKDKKTEVFPGCFVEKKPFSQLVDELSRKGKKISVLDKKGRNIRYIDLKDCVFVIGDHEGLPEKETKNFNKISIGKETYFSSQTITIIHHELDIRIR